VPEELISLLLKNDKKKLFVGIGNLLKKDDGVGVFISAGIKKGRNIEALTVEVSLENYIGKINNIDPDILVLIDCVEMGSVPGTSKLMSVSKLDDLTFNTHNISLKRISEFFKMPVFLLGIQPEKIDFGENMSYLVKEEAKKIINIINSY
jgi:hydrogenase 3 maturation protease